ncbi:hypothetical protein F4778DRAFT_783891 [Xylariomycetidae sp. FL2044]|nr:hypothetical protein F4778DRAFT_783891 [Xylariomycetidae sp. FL2044]
MSRLTQYRSFIIEAQGVLMSRGKLWFSPKDLLPSTSVERFYRNGLREVGAARLVDRRKELYWRFTREVINAHDVVKGGPTGFGTGEDLESSLRHISEALGLMATLKNYNDQFPVDWSEVLPFECMQRSSSPAALWMHFLLESVRPCLLLLVRILWLALPDFSDLWQETEESLNHRDWLLQFILDTEESQARHIASRPRPRRCDVFGHITSTRKA